MVTSVEVDSNDEVCGVSTFFGITFACKAAVLTTGTFMNGQASVVAERVGSSEECVCVCVFLCQGVGSS